MKSKPFVIYTACDRKYGDFLIEHWYRSLRENVDLTQVDVRVLDYGLSTAQAYYLSHEGATLVPCLKDGHVAVIRFRDLARDLRRQSYQQVLAVDGGDILFQGNIAGLFEQHPDQFRAVVEDLRVGFELFLREDYFSRETIARIRESTALVGQVNAGFLVGPRQKFLDLCDTVNQLVLDQSVFGPDQLVVNLVLNETGFHALPCDYNFVVATARREFVLEAGTFLFADDRRPIPVVHNAGNWKFLRPVEDFGYGPTRNRLKPDVLNTLKLVHQTNHLIHATKGRISRFARSALESARVS